MNSRSVIESSRIIFTCEGSQVLFSLVEHQQNLPRFTILRNTSISRPSEVAYILSLEPLLISCDDNLVGSHWLDEVHQSFSSSLGQRCQALLNILIKFKFNVCGMTFFKVYVRWSITLVLRTILIIWRGCLLPKYCMCLLYWQVIILIEWWGTIIFWHWYLFVMLCLHCLGKRLKVDLNNTIEWSLGLVLEWYYVLAKMAWSVIYDMVTGLEVRYLYFSSLRNFIK